MLADQLTAQQEFGCFRSRALGQCAACSPKFLPQACRRLTQGCDANGRDASRDDDGDHGDRRQCTRRLCRARARARARSCSRSVRGSAARPEAPRRRRDPDRPTFAVALDGRRRRRGLGGHELHIPVTPLVEVTARLGAIVHGARPVADAPTATDRLSEIPLIGGARIRLTDGIVRGYLEGRGRLHLRARRRGVRAASATTASTSISGRRSARRSRSGASTIARRRVVLRLAGSRSRDRRDGVRRCARLYVLTAPNREDVM